MNKNKKRTIVFRISAIKQFFIVVFSMLVMPLFSQHITVSGVVKDAKTYIPIDFANVQFTNTSIGECTGIDGRFSISNNIGIKSVKISLIGYKDTIIELTVNRTPNLIVYLSTSETILHIYS